MPNLYHYWKKLMITERVTWLESFNACPHKYNKVPFDWSNIDTLVAVTTGDIVHIAHQYPSVATILADIFFNQTLVELTGSRNNLKFEQTQKMIDLACWWIDKYKNFEKYFEVKNSMIIEWVMVTWSYDCLMIDADWSYHLWDYKTAWSISYYSNRVEKVQPLIYSYFCMKQFWIDKLKFTYLIYVKWKDNNKVTVEEKTMTMYKNKVWLLNNKEYIDNVEEKVKKICNDYKNAKESWWFFPSDTNEDWSASSCCWYCPMRNADKAAEYWLEVCPLKKDLSSLDWWAIEF